MTVIALILVVAFLALAIMPPGWPALAGLAAGAALLAMLETQTRGGDGPSPLGLIVLFGWGVLGLAVAVQGLRWAIAGWRRGLIYPAVVASLALVVAVVVLNVY